MPTRNYTIPANYPTRSVMEMAEQIGKITGTVVVCQPVLQIEAAEPVLKALDALLPALRKTKRARQAQAPVEAAPAAEVSHE